MWIFKHFLILLSFDVRWVWDDPYSSLHVDVADEAFDVWQYKAVLCSSPDDVLLLLYMVGWLGSLLVSKMIPFSPLILFKSWKGNSPLSSISTKIRKCASAFIHLEPPPSSAYLVQILGSRLLECRSFSILFHSCIQITQEGWQGIPHCHTDVSFVKFSSIIQITLCDGHFSKLHKHTGFPFSRQRFLR